MSNLTPALVQALADTLDFGALSSDAAESLAPHLEVRLREIIQDALKFMRRSKRHTLSPDDINSALIAKSKEVSILLYDTDLPVKQCRFCLCWIVPVITNQDGA